MNNSFFSNIKRSLKVTTNYILSLIIFLLFSLPIISMAKDGSRTAMLIFSFFVFLALFYMVYVDMRVTAFREKRPQYNINPPFWKGFLYGVAGIVPLIIFQIILIVVQVPEEFLTLKRRVYQGLGGPLYWLANLLGNGEIQYLVSFLVIIIIAGLGYYAGYKDFYLLAVVRKRLGIEPRKKAKKSK